MRLALVFFMILCFFIGLMAAVGAGAMWTNNNEDGAGFVGFFIALLFIGLGARYAFSLGKMERERRLFFPRRRWWQ